MPGAPSLRAFPAQGWETMNLASARMAAPAASNPPPGAPSLRAFLAQGWETKNLTPHEWPRQRRLPHRRWMYTSPVMQVFVILPAAGLGTRMAGPQPKQFLALNGLPILIHSLRAFASVERVTAIYVAVRKTEIERVEAQVEEYGFASRVRVVEGGDNRQESVSHALAALPAQLDDVVLVHDAVRPLIDAATIDRTIDAVIEFGAAIVGLPAVDTIKQVERTAHGALVTSTIPREFVVLAQTPQGFRYGLLQRAFAEATADGFVGTDEASVVERAGLPVAVVHGSQVNLKITQPGDLELAEFYLGQKAR